MPQRIFKRKSTRNFESTMQEVRTDDIGSGTDGNSSTPSVKSDATADGGMVIPNRIFVGGVSSSATEWDLRTRFSNYGNVKAVKIVRDQMGISRGYAFITFLTENEARRVIDKVEIIFKGRKLNIGPAIKKQNYLLEKQIHADSQEPIDEKKFNQQKFQINERPPAQYSGDYPNYNGPAFLIDNSTIPTDNGLYHNAVDLPSGFNSSQVNIIPYPVSMVYLPQHAFQYPQQGIPYPINGTVSEMIQFLPGSFCCYNEP